MSPTFMPNFKEIHQYLVPPIVQKPSKTTHAKTFNYMLWKF